MSAFDYVVISFEAVCVSVDVWVHFCDGVFLRNAKLHFRWNPRVKMALATVFDGQAIFVATLSG